MSLQSVAGNISTNFQNDIQTTISQAKNFFNNLFGQVQADLSHIWDGGFAGIDQNGLETLKGAIETYCQRIEGVITGFNQNANVEQAFKGPIADACASYVDSVKGLIAAYVSTVRAEKTDAGTAFENYAIGAQQLSQNMVSDSDTIRQQAQSIRIDD